MKTTKQIQVTTIGGSVKTITEITTDERKGQALGTAIRGDDVILSEATDHIEREDSATMTFSFGTVRKDRIESLVFHNDGFGGVCVRVNFAK